MRKIVINLMGCLSLLCFSSIASASLLSVNYTDNDGPQWSGLVDTTTDSLSIQTWIEGAGGNLYWTPSALPLTFTAYLCPSFDCTFAQLSPYDVPDSWDGTIGASWGFLSDLTKDAIAWNEGVFTGNASRLGWGIAQFNGGSIMSSFGTEDSFSFVPYSSTANRTVLADELTVTRVSNVPTPATLALFGLGLAGLGWSRRKKA